MKRSRKQKGASIVASATSAETAFSSVLIGPLPWKKSFLSLLSTPACARRAAFALTNVRATP
jgi:hypothetical protein